MFGPLFCIKGYCLLPGLGVSKLSSFHESSTSAEQKGIASCKTKISVDFMFTVLPFFCYLKLYNSAESVPDNNPF